MTGPSIRLRAFAPADQVPVRRLVLQGLGEHFGSLDETRNPDLDDVAAAYTDAGHAIVVAEIDGEIVGTGALVGESPDVGRLVRMSVGSSHRRRGIGRALVAHLLGLARARGARRVLVETNDDWHDAIRLYRSCGFVEQARADGEVHLAFDL